MGTKKSTKPTGLSVARSGNTYTLSWKVGAKNYDDGQTIQYKVNDGALQQQKWANGNTTSISFTVGGVNKIWFRVHGNRKNETKTKYSWSDWSEFTWVAVAPGVPSLEFNLDSTNVGTFSWSFSPSTTDNAPFYRVEKCTCVVTHTGFPTEAEWGAVATVPNPSSQTITEVTTGNFVRWFRVRTVGTAGPSAWNVSSHSYGTPNPATLDSAVAQTYGSTSRISANWRIGYDAMHPLDTLTIQYAIEVPTDAALSAPASGWDDAIEVTPNGGSGAVVVNIADTLGDDECMWVRIKSTHDDNNSYSNEVCAQIGSLQTPGIDATPNGTTGDVGFTITENTSCAAANTAIFFRAEGDPSNDRIIAILTNGTTSTTVNVPDIVGASTTCFGAFAFVGAYTGTTITAIKMRSESAIDSDIVPLAPATVSATAGPADGTVRIGWSWTWTDATKAEISWADNDYAWESTDEPSNYVVEDIYATSWVITGLETGKRWYFKVRLIDGSDDDDIIGPWSTMMSFDLSSAPDRPVLSLSKTVINGGGSFVAKWAYASSGSDTQAYAEVCEAVTSGGVTTYTPIAHTETSQSVEITSEWTTGTSHDLCVRVTSSSGIQSEYSDLVSVYVADPVNIDITQSSILIGDDYEMVQSVKTATYVDGVLSGEVMSSSMNTVSITDGVTKDIIEKYLTFGVTQTVSVVESAIDEHMTEVTTTVEEYDFSEAPHVEAMPFTATITGAGTSGTTVLSIVRDGNYHLARPDENDFDGYSGETIFTFSQQGETQITANIGDLVGSLDDGATYKMIATVIDTYGQTASVEIPFRVDWTHKADVPSVTVKMDKYQRIAEITPIAPAGYAAGDTCDIYRLSADKPELIYKGAAFGTTYVDPFPAFGEPGGHRLVTITANGDYTTAHGLAWYDADIDDGDILIDKKMVIDVDGTQIELPYNIELHNTWNKDFKRTTYLGGSVQGDWNPAVTRDLNANTVLLRGRDLDRQLAVRDLADYAGAAHIRTPDGSSFSCDIQVRETIDMKTRRVSYTLTVKAIDPEAPAGMTLEEWQDAHPAGE